MRLVQTLILSLCLSIPLLAQEGGILSYCGLDPWYDQSVFMPEKPRPEADGWGGLTTTLMEWISIGGGIDHKET